MKIVEAFLCFALHASVALHRKRCYKAEVSRRARYIKRKFSY